MGEAVEVLTGAARPILDRWFESEELKATLATDAIIGAFAAPSMPGTAYVLFHHVMGETNGKKGVWSYVRGGMGRPHAGAREGRDRPRCRDPYRSRSRAHPRQKKPCDRRRAHERRRISREDGREQRRLPAHLRAIHGSGGLAARLRRRDPAHRLQQRVAQDQRRARLAAELHRVRGHECRSATSRHDPTCAPIKTISSAVTTMRSTGDPRGNRSSSARFRPPSTRRSHRPAGI